MRLWFKSLFLQERILDPNIYALPRATSLPAADDVRLDSIRIDQKLRDHIDTEKRFASRDSESIQKLVETLREIREKLKPHHKQLLPAAGAFQANRYQLERRITEIEETFLRSSFGFAVHPPLASEIFSTCRMASVGGSVWNTGMSFVAV